MKIELDSTASGVAFWTREDVYFYIKDTLYKVPYGFYSDGMSTPRFLWCLIGPQIQKSGITRACVIHDWLYTTHYTNRKTADKILVENLRLAGCPFWKRTLIYYGVRLFGGLHWTNSKGKPICMQK